MTLNYGLSDNRTSTGNARDNTNSELTVYGELEYEYDDNGNMTEVSLSGQMVFAYHYNADNRLVKVEGGNNNTIAEYYYDPFGRRLWKEVGGVRTYFVAVNGYHSPIFVTWSDIENVWLLKTRLEILCRNKRRIKIHSCPDNRKDIEKIARMIDNTEETQ